MTMLSLTRGEGPVILAQAHGGTDVPDDVAAGLNERGRELIDTDWHVGRLYEGLLESATTVHANFHRYVIDANRDRSGDSLYPGQNTTGLVPLVSFRNEPIWRSPPDDQEIEARRKTYHSAYHEALGNELDRVRGMWGLAVVFDCHSIASRLPFLFEGRLPDLNIGDNNGKTCAPGLTAAIADICERSDYSHVVNGRFRGGWTTRFYGRPSQRVHAIQLEIAQATYLEDEVPPFVYCVQKARKLRNTLRAVLFRTDQWAREQSVKGAAP